MLHSVIPAEEVLADPQQDSMPVVASIAVNQCILEIARLDDGSMRLQRIFSLEPRDYLMPEFQPGRQF